MRITFYPIPPAAWGFRKPVLFFVLVPKLNRDVWHKRLDQTNNGGFVQSFTSVQVQNCSLLQNQFLVLVAQSSIRDNPNLDEVCLKKQSFSMIRCLTWVETIFKYMITFLTWVEIFVLYGHISHQSGNNLLVHDQMFYLIGDILFSSKEDPTEEGPRRKKTQYFDKVKALHCRLDGDTIG